MEPVPVSPNIVATPKAAPSVLKKSDNIEPARKAVSDDAPSADRVTHSDQPGLMSLPDQVLDHVFTQAGRADGTIRAGQLAQTSKQLRESPSVAATAMFGRAKSVANQLETVARTRSFVKMIADVQQLPPDVRGRALQSISLYVGDTLPGAIFPYGVRDIVDSAMLRSPNAANRFAMSPDDRAAVAESLAQSLSDVHVTSKQFPSSAITDEQSAQSLQMILELVTTLPANQAAGAIKIAARSLDTMPAQSRSEASAQLLAATERLPAPQRASALMNIIPAVAKNAVFPVRDMLHRLSGMTSPERSAVVMGYANGLSHQPAAVKSEALSAIMQNDADLGSADFAHALSSIAPHITSDRLTDYLGTVRTGVSLDHRGPILQQAPSLLANLPSRVDRRIAYDDLSRALPVAGSNRDAAEAIDGLAGALPLLDPLARAPRYASLVRELPRLDTDTLSATIAPLTKALGKLDPDGPEMLALMDGGQFNEADLLAFTQSIGETKKTSFTMLFEHTLRLPETPGVDQSIQNPRAHALGALRDALPQLPVEAQPEAATKLLAAASKLESADARTSLLAEIAPFTAGQH